MHNYFRHIFLISKHIPYFNIFSSFQHIFLISTQFPYFYVKNLIGSFTGGETNASSSSTTTTRQFYNRKCVLVAKQRLAQECINLFYKSVQHFCNAAFLLFKQLTGESTTDCDCCLFVRSGTSNAKELSLCQKPQCVKWTLQIVFLTLLYQFCYGVLSRSGFFVLRNCQIG